MNVLEREPAIQELVRQVVAREQHERHQPGSAAAAQERAFRRRLLKAGYPPGQVEMLSTMGLLRTDSLLHTLDPRHVALTERAEGPGTAPAAAIAAATEASVAVWATRLGSGRGGA